jgi:hypothetical protein
MVGNGSGVTTDPAVRDCAPQPDPKLLGAQDACGIGMGGVWFPTTTKLHERRTTKVHGRLLLLAPFDEDMITSDLVSFENPQGTVTNSDLELAAGLVQNDVAAHSFYIRKRTIASGSDNIPTLAWQRKGSTTTTAAPAYLLRVQALHQCFYRYNSFSFFVPGKLNAMADDCSRMWYLTDHELLTHFDLTYPQTASWHIVHPKSGMLSSVTSALRRQRPNPASFLHAPMPTVGPGSSRPVSATISSLTLGCPTPATLSFSYKSLPNATKQALLPPVADRSSLERWRAPYMLWVRPLQAWGGHQTLGW